MITSVSFIVITALQVVCETALNTLQDILQYPILFCGGGCWETCLSFHIKQKVTYFAYFSSSFSFFFKHFFAYEIGEMSQKIIMYESFGFSSNDFKIKILILGQYIFDACFWSYSMCFAFFPGERKPELHS